MATCRPVYSTDDYLDDLKVLIKVRGLSPTMAAANLGLSRATVYRLLNQAKKNGDW